MQPKIGSRQGKLWGVTQLAFGFNGVEAHVIQVVRGGYCSKHSHRSKWNRFIVLSGRLRVSVFAGEMVDETIIGEGQGTDVPPGIIHRFEALETTLAVEFYWTTLDPQDIERNGLGGVRA